MGARVPTKADLRNFVVLCVALAAALLYAGSATDDVLYTAPPLGQLYHRYSLYPVWTDYLEHRALEIFAARARLEHIAEHRKKWERVRERLHRSPAQLPETENKQRSAKNPITRAGGDDFQDVMPDWVPTEEEQQQMMAEWDQAEMLSARVYRRNMFLLYVQRQQIRARRHSDSMYLETLHFLRFLTTTIPQLKKHWRGNDFCQWKGVTCTVVKVPLYTLIDRENDDVQFFEQLPRYPPHAVLFPDGGEDDTAGAGRFSADGWSTAEFAQRLNPFRPRWAPAERLRQSSPSTFALHNLVGEWDSDEHLAAELRQELPFVVASVNLRGMRLRGYLPQIYPVEGFRTSYFAKYGKMPPSPYRNISINDAHMDQTGVEDGVLREELCDGCRNAGELFVATPRQSEYWLAPPTDGEDSQKPDPTPSSAEAARRNIRRRLKKVLKNLEKLGKYNQHFDIACYFAEHFAVYRRDVVQNTKSTVSAAAEAAGVKEPTERDARRARRAARIFSSVDSLRVPAADLFFPRIEPKILFVRKLHRHYPLSLLRPGARQNETWTDPNTLMSVSTTIYPSEDKAVLSTNNNNLTVPVMWRVDEDVILGEIEPRLVSIYSMDLRQNPKLLGDVPHSWEFSGYVRK